MVAEGRADAYPRYAPTMEWDTAAGHAIAKYAGYSVSEYLSTNELNYNKKELLNNFKGKIKDTHIPKENTSIVFKFSVTSNGKIKDINIQSRVNIELEKIIKETALKLSTWTKGSQRIPVIYTVYITFK